MLPDNVGQFALSPSLRVSFTDVSVSIISELLRIYKINHPA
jgi:hypothetical protein